MIMTIETLAQTDSLERLALSGESEPKEVISYDEYNELLCDLEYYDQAAYAYGDKSAEQKVRSIRRRLASVTVS